MSALKKLSKLLFTPVFFQKILAYLVLVVSMYILRDFLLILFLTFIFAYLFGTFGRFLKLYIHKALEKYVPSKKYVACLKRIFSEHVMIMLVYIFFLVIVFFALSDLSRELIKELSELSTRVSFLKDYLDAITAKLEEVSNFNSQLEKWLGDIFTQQDIDTFFVFLVKMKEYGAIIIKVIVSLILSYMFIVDREKLGTYLLGMKNSHFGFFYEEYKKIIAKIVKTFGAVFKAQSMIALVNALLTTVGIILIGLFYGQTFPALYTITIIVFICGFIPVLGTFISSIPILLIGYANYGGWNILIAIIFLISVVHAIEAYYLNPKIVSSYTKLPLSLTFLILILSEYLLWFVGLVLGVATFYFLLEILKEINTIIDNSKKTLREMDELESETKKSLRQKLRMSRKVEEE